MFAEDILSRPALGYWLTLARILPQHGPLFNLFIFFGSELLSGTGTSRYFNGGEVFVINCHRTPFLCTVVFALKIVSEEFGLETILQHAFSFERFVNELYTRF